MKLVLGLGAEHENPSETKIREVIHPLPGGHDSFAILSCDAEHYILAVGGGLDGFVLDYCEGSWDQHFRCSDTSLSTEIVIEAFLSYTCGGGKPESLEWVIAEKPPLSTSTIILILIGFVVIVSLVAYLVGRIA